MTTEKIWGSLRSLPPVLWAISTPTYPTSRRQYTATFAAPKVQPQNPSQSFPNPNSTQARYPTATLPSASVLLRRDKSGSVLLRRDKSGFVTLRRDKSGSVLLRRDKSSFVTLRRDKQTVSQSRRLVLSGATAEPGHSP